MPYDPSRHGPRRIVGPGFHEKVFAVVRLVPAGWVSTYGDVAGALGLRGAARQVGFALAALNDSHPDLPWHRVVNARGELSTRADADAFAEQRRRLLVEGVEVTPEGRIIDFASLRFVFE